MLWAYLSSPMSVSAKRIKKHARYLKAAYTTEIRYLDAAEDDVQFPDVHVDSDWAGCQRTRKSTSGGVVCHGSHCLAHWSKTQANVALSSGEAELNAVLKGGAEVLALKHLMQECGSVKEAHVRSDSGACVGTVHRRSWKNQAFGS